MLGFAHSLPSERRGAIREIVRNAQPRIGPLRREARQSRGEVARLIAAEPFDRARLEAASARLAEAEGRLRLEGHKLAVEIAAALTPEERSRFSSWRAARRGGWAHRGRGELEEPSDEKQPATKP
jgi:Spy/CpxP family protein refolding chaperone